MQKFKNFSIKRRVLYVLLMILVPAMSFLLLFNVFVMREVYQKQADTYRTALDLYAAPIEKSMEQMDKSLAGLVGNNGYMQELAYGNTTKTKAWGNIYELSQNFSWMMGTDDNIAAMFVMAADYGLYHGVYNECIVGVNYKDTMIDTFKDKIADNTIIRHNGWSYIAISGHPFLYRAVGILNTYCIALLGIENFSVPQNDFGNPENELTEGIIFTQEDIACTMTDFVKEAGLDFNGSQDAYFSGNRDSYMIVERPVAGTNLNMAYVSAYKGLWPALSHWQVILILGTAIVFALLPVGYWIIKKSFFKPVDRLIASMENTCESEDGFLNAPQEIYPEIEFQRVNKVFQYMMERIRHLKIEAYEKELAVSRVTLQYYQIQIKPHFFLNCMKSIYGMAQEHAYDKIQKNILYLSRHLRYMLREDSEMVTIREEMEYVSNYILLQKMSMKYPPFCDVDTSTETLDILIPAISILSFVENSVKYCINADSKIRIRIKTAMLQTDDGSLLNITIQDNGQGFTQEQLRQYNFYKKSLDKGGNGEHLGINNVIQRFLLVYGEERVGFVFSNDKGAKIDILIKFRLEDEK